MIGPVKKIFLILMLALLPLQFSWAAVAVYCQHEQEASTHFGHHSHEHEADATAQIDDSSDEGALAKVDADCAVCHISAQPSFLNSPPIVTPPQVATHATQLQTDYSSHIPEGPQKPDWQLVA
jgi:hypothetical protein